MPATDPIQLFAVHGNGGGAARFDLMRAHMPEGVDLVAEDLPGFGARAVDGALESVGAYGAFLADRVAALPRPRVVLGHGIGGSLVLEMLQRPGVAEGLDGVILHAPVGANLDTRKLPLVMRSRAMRWAGRRALATPMLRRMWRRKLFTGPLPIEAERAFFAGYRDCPGFGPMFEWLTADWFRALQPVSVPAVLLWGTEEKVLDAAQAQAFLPVLPKGTVEMVEGWGHFPMLEQAADYSRSVGALAQGLVDPAREAL